VRCKKNEKKKRNGKNLKKMWKIHIHTSTFPDIDGYKIGALIYVKDPGIRYGENGVDPIA